MLATLKMARLFFVALAVVATGRWLMSVFDVPYERGDRAFSILILTSYAAFFLGACARRWLRFRLLQVAFLGLVMGFSAQLVTLALTAASYLLGMETYYNHPASLNAEGPLTFAQGIIVRLSCLVVNSVNAAIIAALGWALGHLLPEK
jgi:hypothetical protein